MGLPKGWVKTNIDDALFAWERTGIGFAIKDHNNDYLAADRWSQLVEANARVCLVYLVKLPYKIILVIFGWLVELNYFSSILVLVFKSLVTKLTKI